MLHSVHQSRDSQGSFDIHMTSESVKKAKQKVKIYDILEIQRKLFVSRGTETDQFYEQIRERRFEKVKHKMHYLYQKEYCSSDSDDS